MLRRSLLATFSFVALLACSSGSDNGTSGGGLITPKNAYFCTAPAPSGCALVNVCGACVSPPKNELKRTTDAKEYTGSGAPDVSCFNEATPPTPVGTSKLVKMKGYVKIFANCPD
jgi:hypothetical protein